MESPMDFYLNALSGISFPVRVKLEKLSEIVNSQKTRVWLSDNFYRNSRIFTKNGISIKITGGLGDHLNAICSLQALLVQSNSLQLKIHICSDNKVAMKTIKALFYRINFCKDCIDQNESLHHRYSATKLVFLEHVLVLRNKLNLPISKYLNLQTEDSDLIVSHHPLLGGLAADMASNLGLNKIQWYFRQFGIHNVIPPEISVDKSEVELPDKFITIHDGVDENLKSSIIGISTKQLRAGQWEEIILRIKKKHPDLKILQLGVKGSQDILGVDLDLRGKTSLLEAASILKKSALHLDSDSGLARLAWCVGSQNITIFLSTQPDYYALPGTIVIRPKSCGGCAWWATQHDWLSTCYFNPITLPCRESLSLEEVANEADAYLNLKLDKSKKG